VNTDNIPIEVNGVNTVRILVRVKERVAYHHGELKQALLQAAVEAAREGGEAAVGLNRLAATVGVSAAAAYRHFPGGLEDLLVAVGDVARRELTEQISSRTSEVKPSRDRRTAAVRRFRASGCAYVEYVLDQPGLFQVACRHDRGRIPGADPFGLLEQCIDELAATGALKGDRRTQQRQPGRRCTASPCS
jgi:AcrR family transcriptional regulator